MYICLSVHYYEKTASDKYRFYRLLENATYNWLLFILKLSYLIQRDAAGKGEGRIFLY